MGAGGRATRDAAAGPVEAYGVVGDARFREATGLSPGAWLLAERVARARELLEDPAPSIEDVAAACGFGTAAGLRHHFRASVGTSPAAYRARFGRPG